jgi:glycolate oxidase FAD binding subunit
LGVALEAIVGAEHVEHPVGASLDGVPVRVVVRPADARQVAACLRAAAEAGLALLACGGRTKLSWGNACAASELVLLDVSRLDAPCEIDAQEGIAKLGAGVRVADLAERLRAVGKRTRLPALHAGATVGGCVAADPFDPGRTQDGSLRQDLLGLEVALASGELTRCGGSVVKNVTGFDLVRLYCGSAGTLGVITQVILRLRPLPEASQVLARACASLEDALRCIAQLASRGAAPDAALLEPDAGGFRLTWLLEGGRSDVDERARRFAGDVVDAAGWSTALARWAEPPPPDQLAVRVAARPADLPSILAALLDCCGAEGVVSLAPLLGAIRVHGSPAGLPALAERAQRESWALFVDAAPADAKRHFDVYGPAPDALPVLRALKARFDPRRTLAPGRFVARI